MSRGDITKVENFEKTEQCLSIMRKLVLEYKQNPSTIDTITAAIQNVKDLKGPFIKGFALDVEFPILIYNLMVLCIERSVSMIIATCVEFISDPKTKTMKQALDKVAYTRSQEDVMFKQLVTFNTLCKNGTMIKLIDATIKGNNKLRESAEYDVKNTPEDNDIDAIMPVEVTSEDDDPVLDPFGSDDTPPIANEVPATPTPDPIAPDLEEIPSQEPVVGDQMSSDEPTEVPQTDELPVTEPDDAPEPIPTQVPVEPEQETGPDVAPNPETDPNLDTEDPIIENEPEEVPPMAAEPNEEPQEYVPDPSAEEPYTEAADNEKKNIIKKAAEFYGKAQTTKAKIGAAGVIIGSTALLAIGLPILIKEILVRVLIPSIRSIIYKAMYTSFKVSDYFRIQAEFFEANADEIENSSDMDPDKKEKVVKKQRKWAETFRKWSNLFNLDNKKSDQEAQKKMKEDEKNKKKVETNDDGEDVLF